MMSPRYFSGVMCVAGVAANLVCAMSFHTRASTSSSNIPHCDFVESVGRKALPSCERHVNVARVHVCVKIAFDKYGVCILTPSLRGSAHFIFRAAER